MESLESLIRIAYLEDAYEDKTATLLKLDGVVGIAKVQALGDLVVFGCSVFESCIKYNDPDAKVSWKFKDGDIVLQDQTVCLIEGTITKMLFASQVALNFLSHLTGITTFTKCYKEVLKDKIKLLDTNENRPLLRELEKKAVVAGGGHNTINNRSNSIFVKKNHIVALDNDLKKVLKIVTKNKDLPIHVEVTNLDEVKIAIDFEVDRVIMDMPNKNIQKALKIIPPTIEKEVTGIISPDRVSELASMDINYVSVGAITNQAPSGNFTFQLIESLSYIPPHPTGAGD